MRAAEEERLARIAELKALREKEKRENFEHGLRCEQLQNTCTRISSLISFNFELAMAEKKQREVSCELVGVEFDQFLMKLMILGFFDKTVQCMLLFNINKLILDKIFNRKQFW